MIPLATMDTEGTGLDIYHGCRPYMVTACTAKLNYKWAGEVDASSRIVRWRRSELNDLRSFVSKCKRLVFHNSNYDIRALAAIDVPVANWVYINPIPGNFPIIDDTLIASHIVCSGSRKVGHPHGLKELCVKYFGYDNSDEIVLQNAVTRTRALGHKATVGHPHFPAATEASWAQDMWMEPELCTIYAIKDVERTFILYEALMARIAQLNLYHKYEQRMKLSASLYRTQTTGINIYVNKAKRVVDELDKQIPVLSELIRTSAGIKQEFDPASPIDLRYLLYTVLNLPVHKRTETGAPATDEKTLNTLYEEHEEVQSIKYLMHWKKATKMRTDIASYIVYASPPSMPSTIIIEDVSTNPPSTFPSTSNPPSSSQSTSQSVSPSQSISPSPSPTRPPELIFDAPIFEHNKIHSTYNTTGTKWTRQSGSEPNPQNFSKKLKFLFGPPKGYYWFYCDVVNIELRIWAYEVGSKDLIARFESGESVHMIIAKILYKDMLQNLGEAAFKETKTYTNCKGGTFARIYGGGIRKVEQTYGVKNACAIIDEMCPEIGLYFQQLNSQMETNAQLLDYPCIFTRTGYKLDVPVTAPHSVPSARIQGSAGEVIQDMMVKIETFPVFKLRNCKLVNQVHDSLFIEIPIHSDSEATNIAINQRLEQIGQDHIPTCPMDYMVIEYHGDEEPYFNDYLYIPENRDGYTIDMLMHNKQYLCIATKDNCPTFKSYAPTRHEAHNNVKAQLDKYQEIPF